LNYLYLSCSASYCCWWEQVNCFIEFAKDSIDITELLISWRILECSLNESVAITILLAGSAVLSYPSREMKIIQENCYLNETPICWYFFRWITRFYAKNYVFALNYQNYCNKPMNIHNYFLLSSLILAILLAILLHLQNGSTIHTSPRKCLLLILSELFIESSLTLYWSFNFSAPLLMSLFGCKF